ncbi:hypothetical protein L596_010904 [Steinernema carpocapsae]|uniref:Serine protease n=1 Tax=Steinernema carpocapsae TaxID=34508 RepID=A0A4U5PKF7_STECR|nr:hypothetical protein L596_010904 [Steinernema carpocapsae]
MRRWCLGMNKMKWFLSALFVLGCLHEALASCNFRFDGSDLSDGCFPSQVYFTDAALTHAQCTGTIILPNIVLTSAHCTIGWTPTKQTIFIGGGRPNPRRVYGGERWSRVKEFVKNPGFTEQECMDTKVNYCANDIAIVMLTENIYEPEFVSSPFNALRVKVRNALVAASTPKDGTAVFGAGYGFIEGIQRLRYTDGVLRSGMQCSDHPDRPSPNYICIDAASTGGDSGSGFFVRTVGGKKLIGITLVGGGKMTSFTEVSMYCGFIKTELKKWNIDFECL